MLQFKFFGECSFILLYYFPKLSNRLKRVKFKQNLFVTPCSKNSKHPKHLNFQSEGALKNFGSFFSGLPFDMCPLSFLGCEPKAKFATITRHERLFCHLHVSAFYHYSLSLYLGATSLKP